MSTAINMLIPFPENVSFSLGKVVATLEPFPSKKRESPVKTEYYLPNIVTILAIFSGIILFPKISFKY